MYCIFLSKCLNGKLRCKIKKQAVILDECKKCLKFQPRVNKTINKKSNKQRNLEQKRFSILTTDMKKCFYCGNKTTDIHEIYKGSNRLASMKNGFCIPLCRKCHLKTENDIKFLRKFQKQCQLKYMENRTLEDFMKVIGENFLKKM